MVEYHLDLKNNEVVVGMNELWNDLSTVDVAIKVQDMITNATDV